MCIFPHVDVNAFAAASSSAGAGNAGPRAPTFLALAFHAHVFRALAFHAHVAGHVGRFPVVLLSGLVVSLQCLFVCVMIVADFVYALVTPAGIAIFTTMFCLLFLAPVARTQVVAPSRPEKCVHAANQCWILLLEVLKEARQHF